MHPKGSSALRYFAVLVAGMIIGASLWAALPALFPAKDQRTLDQRYLDAIDDATLGESRTFYDGLIPVVQGNAYLRWREGMVLALTFTHYPDSYQVNRTGENYWGDLWLTMVPELKDVFANLTGFDNKTIRVAQLLGLDWNTKDSYMVELWVHPADLFRPAADNEIDDSVAYLNSTITDPAYKAWFEGETANAYFQFPKSDGYPWTRLGMTYDWGSSSHIGLSEFVLKRNSTFLTKSVQTLDQYLVS
jgi:hypothetical protein